MSFYIASNPDVCECYLNLPRPESINKSSGPDWRPRLEEFGHVVALNEGAVIVCDRCEARWALRKDGALEPPYYWRPDV